MPTRLRRGLRFAGKSAWYGFALVALLLALAVGAATQGLRWLEQHPARVAGWLAARAGQPVAFSGLKADWTRRGPLLALTGLRIGPGADAIPMGQAEVLIAPYAGWLPGRRLTELRLHGLDLRLERNAAGEWHVRGLPGQAGSADPLDTLEGLGELQVIGGRLRVSAPAQGIEVEVPRVDLRVQVDGARVRAGVRAWPREGAAPLFGSLDVDRRRGDGRAYFGARQVDLAGWSALLRWQGVMAVAGSGRAETWVQLRAHRIAGIVSRSALRDLVLQPVSATPGGSAELRFEQWRQQARFSRSGDGWRLDIPQLEWRHGGQRTRLDGMRARAAGGQWAMRARRIELAPLLSILDMSDQLPTALRHWLGRAQPRGVLSAIEAQGRDGQLGRLSARGDQLGFLAVGNAPGLTGLAGALNGDADGLTLALDPRAAMVFDWPRGFGAPHPIHARGTLALWREGAGVRVGTDALHIDGVGYKAEARGGLWFQNDGTRPWIDIAARIDQADVTVAKRFWIRYLMPQPAIEWLDTALVGGRLRNARAIVSGDLDDWPFDARNGRFEARTDIENGRVRFHPEWPPVENARLHAAFIGPGMQVQGSGSLAGVQVDAISAEIADFGRGGLAIGAHGHGDAAQLLGLLRASPLQKTLGSTLARITAEGPAAVTFSLFQPLHADAPPQRIAGTVDLQGARLRERELKLSFDRVRGQARYDGHGFSADRLTVLHEGQPGRLGLRAGAPHVRDAGNAFEADLSAQIGSDALLARAPELAWLKPWLQGRSEWTVAVALPLGSDGANARPSRVTLRSNLVGTAIRLPSPLGKEAGEPLPSEVRIPLPFAGGEVDVQLGRRLALRAASRGGRTGIRAQLGGAEVGGPPPAQGLVVEGRAAEVDALAWAGVATGDGPKGGRDLGPVRIDVRAARLLLLGQRYADARLQMLPVAGGHRVQVDAPALAGSLVIPSADGAPVRGRFARAAFALGKPPDGGARPGAAETDIDPARVPPLDIAIDEARINGNVLGSLSLRTRPAAAGLLLESLQVRAPRQALDLQGTWTGRGAAARSRLQAQVRSEDYGALLARLGYPGQVKKGAGEIHANLGWAGAPIDFSPRTLQGELQMKLRDGQLTALDPGAGRVLGLLSVARLPQRLTLDFRDLFDKGFAFDRIEGKVGFDGGLARSQGFGIEGPAARIEIGGQADMVNERFDQLIEVKPRTGNLLTVAGALAGGPVGAAVGAEANAVLKKPLSEVGAKTYRVTGPWRAPKVEVVAKSRAAAGRPPP